MSRNKRNYGQAAYEKNRGTNSAGNRDFYVYGNAVRRLDAAEPYREAPTKQPAPVVRKNREKAHHMSFGYVLFLVAAMCTAAYVLLNYIQLQGKLTTTTNYIASKEVELNNLRVANDEEYSRVMGSIDLEEIKRIAIGELGMVYAEEGQVVIYKNEQNDYMRQAVKTNR